MAKSSKSATKQRSSGSKRTKGPVRNNINDKLKDDLLSYYRDMVLIRRFEEKAGQLYGMGLIGGFCHLYIGQEAVVVGMQAAIDDKSSVVTSYRDHGHMLACGMDPNGVMAELTGRVGGYSKGKGGSMHMFSREKNFFGGHGIVAAQVPIGTGLAFAHKYRNEEAVCLTYLGDGAINQGQVYESFNMAALWQLPCIYVIENNQYGMGTAVSRAAAGRELADRGAAYGIPGEKVDGMNVFKVIEAADKAGKYVREGNGPYIIEVQTYRYRGHSMSDPAKYRTKEELDNYKQTDPIEIVKAEILKKKIATNDEIEKINKDTLEEIKNAAEFATNSPFPKESELYTDVYL